MSFVLMALVPMEIASVERAAISGSAHPPWQNDWREIQQHLATEFPRPASYARTPAEFQERILTKLLDTYNDVLAARALSGTITLDASAEAAQHDALVYDAWTLTGQHITLPYDGADDGLILDAACQPLDDGTMGCYVAALLRLDARDETMNIAQTILVST